MPFLFVYSPSDFVQGLPNEQNAAAQGGAPFFLTLAPGATPTLIEVTDDDTVFNEIDGTQALASTVNIDGDTFTAGTTINTAYDLINTVTGDKVTSFHFGGDGFQQGPVDGIASSFEFLPGVTYVFNFERTSFNQANFYTDYIACFAAGTRIATPRGERAVEHLKQGDHVITVDHGAQVLRMAISRDLSADDLATAPQLRPVRIAAGALGSGLPKRDLIVSPQHRLLVVSPIVERVLGISEALLAATKLTGLPGIAVASDLEEVSYHHLIFDAHEVVMAEGTCTESFYPGPMAISSMPAEARAEFDALFPDFQFDSPSRAARLIPPGRKQRAIARRHLKNNKPLIAA